MNDGIVTDGRKRRRAANMDRVLDALHTFDNGARIPTYPQLSEAAQISLRSMYRFFPTYEDMLLAAVTRATERAADLYAVSEAGATTFESRVTGYVERRFALHHVMTPLAVVTRLAAPTMPRLQQARRQARAQLFDMIGDQFRPEMNALSEPQRLNAHLGVHLLCQRESLDTLLVERALPPDAAAAVLRQGITALLQRVS